MRVCEKGGPKLLRLGGAPVGGLVVRLRLARLRQLLGLDFLDGRRQPGNVDRVLAVQRPVQRGDQGRENCTVAQLKYKSVPA